MSKIFFPMDLLLSSTTITIILVVILEWFCSSAITKQVNLNQSSGSQITWWCWSKFHKEKQIPKQRKIGFDCCNSKSALLLQTFAGRSSLDLDQNPLWWFWKVCQTFIRLLAAAYELQIMSSLPLIKYLTGEKVQEQTFVIIRCLCFQFCIWIYVHENWVTDAKLQRFQWTIAFILLKMILVIFRLHFSLDSSTFKISWCDQLSAENSQKEVADWQREPQNWPS